MKAHDENGRFDELVERLADELEPPSDDELRAVAHAAAAEPRTALRRQGWPLRPRWTVAVVATSLLLASGLGFGLGSSLTPSGSAGTPFAGLGFLPAKGWTVMQSDTNGPSDAARAIAANVAFHPDDTLAGGPARTLQTLPRSGVVIQVTFTNRGDPSQDVRFGDVVELPLDLTNARRVSMSAYRLRTGVGGYNLDARISYGSEPSARMRRAAQNQLNRLVVASERVTLLARPTTADFRTRVLLYGSVDNQREGETITIQARPCGQRFFTGVLSATTASGGSWNGEFSSGITTQLRAVWKGSASSPVTIRYIPELFFEQESGRRFEVGVGSGGQFWRKTVTIERRVGRKWVSVRRVVLTETASAPGQPYVFTYEKFRMTIPKGSLLRAVLPPAQAKPCYLGTISDPVRTT